MAAVYEVVPAVIRAQVAVTDLKIRGTGFGEASIRALRFVSPDGVVVLNVTQFEVTTDEILTVASVTFPAVGTYRLQLEGLLGVLAHLDGAAIVNTPPVTFTLVPGDVIVNQVVEGLKLALVGVASEQVGMVRFSGPALFEIDAFDTTDPKTIAFQPLSFGLLGDYDVRLFTDVTGTEAIGSLQAAAFSVVPSPVLPTISGLSEKSLQPGDTASGLLVQGSGFLGTVIDQILVENSEEVFTFAPQPSPFDPDEAIPEGEFRILDDATIMLADFTPTTLGVFGVFLEQVVEGTPEFVGSRPLALTVRDTQKPAVVFDPLPQGFEEPVEVTLTAEFTDPDTGLANGSPDSSCSIYVLVVPIDQRPPMGSLSVNDLPWYDQEFFSGPLFFTEHGYPTAWSVPGNPPIGPSTLYTGPFTVSHSSYVKAVAVDGAGNTSDLFRAFYQIGPQADRVPLPFENPVDSYSRYANVNVALKNLRVKYKALLEEDTVPGVALVAAGNTLGNAVLLRDARRGLIDILHDAGLALDEVLLPPRVRFVSDLQLSLSPGREVFDTSPYPYAPGNDNYRVTRRTTQFGFAETPDDGDYEVLLVPSYAGHSFLDPFIRAAGSDDMPEDMPTATGVPRPVTIFALAATFTVTGGKIDPTTLANVEDRVTARNFTDPDLDRNSRVFPKDIHWRELEIALEGAVLPQGVSTATGDSGVRVGDPVTLPSIGDQPGRLEGFLPPSSVGSPLHSDTAGVLAQAVGDAPQGPKSNTLTQSLIVQGKGTAIKTASRFQFIEFGFTFCQVDPGAGFQLSSNIDTGTLLGPYTGRTWTGIVPPLGGEFFRIGGLIMRATRQLDSPPFDPTIDIPTPKSRELVSFPEYSYPDHTTSGLVDVDYPQTYLEYNRSDYIGFPVVGGFGVPAIDMPVYSDYVSVQGPLTGTWLSPSVQWADPLTKVTVSYGELGSTVDYSQIDTGTFYKVAFTAPNANFPWGVRNVWGTTNIGFLFEEPSNPTDFSNRFYKPRAEYPPPDYHINVNEPLWLRLTAQLYHKVTEQADQTRNVPVTVTYPPSGTTPLYVDVPVEIFEANGQFQLVIDGGGGGGGTTLVGLGVGFGGFGTPPGGAPMGTASDLNISMFNFSTGVYMTMEDSQRAWPQGQVVQNGIVRIRYIPKDTLVIGDVHGVLYSVYINGELAYGPF